MLSRKQLAPFSTILDKTNGTFGHPSPLPHLNDAKIAFFVLRAPSSLLWFWGGGRWGLILPFYSVQDCSLVRSACSVMLSAWFMLRCVGMVRDA